jgi:hypothetical protein
MPSGRLWRVALFFMVALGAVCASIAFLFPTFRAFLVSFGSSPIASSTVAQPERSAEGNTPVVESSGFESWPFRSAREGHWVSYDVFHESKGVAASDAGTSSVQPPGPAQNIEVVSTLRLRAFVLTTKGRILVVPASFEAHVRTGEGNTLFQKSPLSGGGKSIAPLVPATVRGALRENGLLVFAKPESELGFDVGRPQFLQAEGAKETIALVENLLVDGARALALKFPRMHPVVGAQPGFSFDVRESEEVGVSPSAPVSVRYVVEAQGADTWSLSRTLESAGVVSGGLRSRVSASGRLEAAHVPLHVVSFEGERTHVLWQEGHPPLATNHYSWKANRMGTGVLSDASLLEVELLLREALGRTQDSRLSSRAPNLERQMHKETLGNDTLATLLSKLDDLTRGGERADEAEKTALYLKLKALLVLEPLSAKELGVRAAEAGAGSLELQLLAGALSSAGTPEAQAALRDVHAGAPSGSQKRLELVPMLGMAEDPTAGTLLYLEELSRGKPSAESKSALLSLGIAAHKGQAREGELSRRIALSFRERLLAARTSQEIINTLVAGGNSGDRAFLRAASTFVGHSDPSVRSNAILALRFVPFEEFEAEYERALSDREERVRESALLALKQQGARPSLARFLMKAFPLQVSSRLRVGMLNLLWSSRKVNPEVQKFVQEVASDPTLADVQRLASRLLSEGM